MGKGFAILALPSLSSCVSIPNRSVWYVKENVFWRKHAMEIFLMLAFPVLNGFVKKKKVGSDF